MLGMAIAFLATAVISQGYPVQAGSIGIGILIGVLAASRVAMTDMPEMVAFLNSFVGLAAVLVGFAEYLQPTSALVGIEETIHRSKFMSGCSSALSLLPDRWWRCVSSRASYPVDRCCCPPAMC
jgi:NAD(P) transhydrogenase subunit beta